MKMPYNTLGACVLRVVAAHILARVNPNKPYKPRKLKTDQEHRLLREARKHKRVDPGKRAKQKRTRDKWEQRNAPALKLRQKVVREKRKALGLD